MATDDKPAVPDPAASPEASVLPPPPQGATAAAASTSNWQGKRVGNFRIMGFLGRGAMGRVFRAEDTRLKRHVALKVFPTIVDNGKRRVRLDRFIREARSTAALDHPGIVRIYEADEFKGWYYIAMELVEGGPVGHLIEANGPFDAARACQIGAEVGEALEYAHDHGVIHRDVKPDNVLIARGGRAKLVDFGLAYRSDPTDSFHVVDEAVGTAFYIAPEICQGHGATPLSDQYSLAGTVWALLAGAPPFPGTTREELIRHQVHTPLPKLRSLRPDLPEGLCRAIEKGLAKRPEDRHISCEQFAKILRVYTIGSPASASSSGLQPILPPSEPAPTVAPTIPKAATDKPFDRRIPIYAAAGVAALAVVGMGVFLATRGGGEQPAPASPQPTAGVAPAAPTPSVAAQNKPPATPAAAPSNPVAPPPTATASPSAVASAKTDASAKPAAAADGDRFVYTDFSSKGKTQFGWALRKKGEQGGLLDTSVSEIENDPVRGRVQKLSFFDNPAETADKPYNYDGWFLRHLAGRSNRRQDNDIRPSKGWIGLWAKTSTPGVRISIALRNAQEVSADRGLPIPLVSDGQWHCYQWSLEDDTQWEGWMKGDGVITDSPDFTIDSVQFIGPNADAVVYIDDVTQNSAGPIAPPDPAVAVPRKGGR